MFQVIQNVFFKFILAMTKACDIIPARLCFNCVIFSITLVTVRRGDVMSAWSGLRPLVRDPNKKDTKSLARNHIIEISKSKLITIAGDFLT